MISKKNQNINKNKDTSKKDRESCFGNINGKQETEKEEKKAEGKEAK